MWSHPQMGGNGDRNHVMLRVNQPNLPSCERAFRFVDVCNGELPPRSTNRIRRSITAKSPQPVRDAELKQLAHYTPQPIPLRLPRSPPPLKLPAAAVKGTARTAQVVLRPPSRDVANRKRECFFLRSRSYFSGSGRQLGANGRYKQAITCRQDAAILFASSS